MSHADLQHIVRPELGLLAPVIVEKLLMVEGDKLADETAVRLPRCGLDIEVRGSEKFGKLPHPQGHLLITPKLAASAAFNAQKRSGFVQAFAMRIFPSAVTTSASSKPAAAVP